MNFLFGLFLVLHGLVHGLYFGQSARYFELKLGMVWPDGSWALSRLLGDGATRQLASAVLLLTAIGFAAGGLGVFLSQAWWAIRRRPRRWCKTCPTLALRLSKRGI